MKAFSRTFQGAMTTVADTSQSLVATAFNPLFSVMRDLLAGTKAQEFNDGLATFLQGEEAIKASQLFARSVKTVAEAIRSGLPEGLSVAGGFMDAVLKTLGGIGGAVTASGGPLNAFITSSVSGFKAMAEILSNDVIRKLGASIIVARALFGFISSNPLVATLGASTALVGFLANAYENNQYGVRSAFDRAAPGILSSADSIANSVIPGVSSAAAASIGTLAATIASALSTAMPVIDGILAAFAGIMKVIEPLAPLFGVLFAGFVGGKLLVDGLALAMTKFANAAARSAEQMAKLKISMFAFKALGAVESYGMQRLVPIQRQDQDGNLVASGFGVDNTPGKTITSPALVRAIAFIEALGASKGGREFIAPAGGVDSVLNTGVDVDYATQRLAELKKYSIDDPKGYNDFLDTVGASERAQIEQALAAGLESVTNRVKGFGDKLSAANGKLAKLGVIIDAVRSRLGMLGGVLTGFGMFGSIASNLLGLDESISTVFNNMMMVGMATEALHGAFIALTAATSAQTAALTFGIAGAVMALAFLTGELSKAAQAAFNNNPINTKAKVVTDTRTRLEGQVGKDKAKEMFPELYAEERGFLDDLETYLRRTFALMGASIDPQGAAARYDTQINREMVADSDPSRAQQWLRDNPSWSMSTTGIIGQLEQVQQDKIKQMLREGFSPDEVAKTLNLDQKYVEELYAKWYGAGDAEATKYISLLTKALDATGELLQQAQEAMQKAMEAFQTPLNRLMSRAQVAIQALFEAEKEALEQEKVAALANVEVLYDGEMIRLGVLEQQYEALQAQAKQMEKLQQLEESRTRASEAALDMFDASVDPLERARAARDAAREMFQDEQRARLDSMGAAIQSGKTSSAYVGTTQFYDEKARALELDQAERSRVMQERIDDLLKKIQEGKISKSKASTELKDIFGDVGLDLEVASAQGYSFMESFSSGFMAALQANINSTFAALPKAITAALNVLSQSAAYKKAQDALNAIMNPDSETRTIKGQTMVDLLKARISDAKNLQTKLREYYALVKPEIGGNDPERVKRFNQIGQFLAQLQRMQNVYTPGGKYTTGQYDDLNTGFMEQFQTLLQMVMSGLAGYNPDRNRAMGGSLSSATSYMVGERGPEMLTMFKQGGGYVTPNHKLPSTLKSSAGALRAGAYGRAVGGYVGYGKGIMPQDFVPDPTPGPTPEPSWEPTPTPTPRPTPTGTPSPTPTPTAGPTPTTTNDPWGLFPFNFRMYTKWINSVIPLGGIGRIYGGPNGEFTGYNRGTTTPFEEDDAFAVVKRPNWWDRFKNDIGVRKIAPFNWEGPGNIKTWSPKSGFVPGIKVEGPDGKIKLKPGNAISKSAANVMAQAFRGTAILSTGMSFFDILGASERGESPARAWVRNIAMNVGALAMAVPNVAGVVASGGMATAGMFAANAAVATALDAISGSVYDLLFGNVWDGKQTQQSIDMGQKKDLGFFGNLFNYNRGFNNPAPKPSLTPGSELLNLPSPTAMPKIRFGGGRAEGGPVDATDVGRGYDGKLSWLEDYTNPATRFIHQILPPGMSNSNLAGVGGFVDILSALYGAGLKSIMPGPDLADALARLVGSGKLPGPLETLARNMLGLSQLSNISRPMSLRDTYELDPGLDIVKRGIWGRGSRPLSTGVVSSIVGGLAGDYGHLGNLLSGDASDLMSLGGADPITSVVTRPGYKPPHVTTSFNDFLSGDYHFPFFATDPASFPENKRIGFTSALPQSGKGATRLAEFQIPGGIPIDQIETILGLPTLIDDKNGYRPFNDAEAKARAAALAAMGFTDLGNHAVATDVLERQIADWRASSGGMPVDPEQILAAKETILRQQETGRILAGRAAQAASLLRAGVFTNIDEAALYAVTADEHFKGVRAKNIDIEAERTRVARTIPRGGSFEDKVALIRERLLYTQPELFPELGPVDAPALKMLLDDAPVIPKSGGEQLDLFSKFPSSDVVDPYNPAADLQERMMSRVLRVGEGLRGKPAQRTVMGDLRPGMLDTILSLIPGVQAFRDRTSLSQVIDEHRFEGIIGETDKYGNKYSFPIQGLPADLISFDWGDIRIPHTLVGNTSAEKLKIISENIRLALAAAPQGMFDPSDPSKRLTVDLVDGGPDSGFAARVARFDTNNIQVDTRTPLTELPDAMIHEVGHLITNNRYTVPKMYLEAFKPSNLKETIGIIKTKGDLRGHIADLQERMQMKDLTAAYEKSLIAQGFDPIRAKEIATNAANSKPLGRIPTNPTGPEYTMPRNFPLPTIYSGADPMEHFADIFAGHTQESLPDPLSNRGTADPFTQAAFGKLQSAGQLLDLDYERVQAQIAEGTLPASVRPVAAARSQYPREVARAFDFRSIRDPGAVRAGLMPELYGSKYRKVAVPFTGGKLNLPGMKTYTTDQGGFKGTAARADSFVGTKKGNFLSGFLADVAMMAISGNFENFGQLIPSLGFNLLSILPKIGGPAAMIAGLLTTGATGGDMGRAVAGTVGSLVGGLLGNLIPIPFIGGMIGSILGGMLGDWIYTSFINPESAKQGTQMIQAGGGAVYNVGPNAPFPFDGPSNVPFSGEPLRKIGGRAFGGAVRPNVGYMVGERGPELLVPGGLGGSIIPNHKMRGPEGVTAVGGGQTVNASVVINNPSVSNAGDIDKLAKKVAEAQTRALRSAGYARPS
jgi:hypothetical protein